jgi:hypothetical protein
MTTWDRELLEKVFLFLPKSNIDNLGWGTVGVALIVLTSDGRTEGHNPDLVGMHGYSWSASALVL